MEAKKNNLLLYVAIFLGTFLIFNTFFGKKTEDPTLVSADIGIKLNKQSYAVGKAISVTVQNNTEQIITLTDQCPNPIFDVYRFTSEGYVEVEDGVGHNCENSSDLSIQPGKKETVNLQDFAYGIFGTPGSYKLELNTTINEEEKTFTTQDFQIKEPGMLTRLWRVGLYQPILNLLVAALIYMPGHNLALAIIVITLLIRTILLIPSQKGIKAQKAMQELQPKMEAVKKKYKDDQARLAQETMLLYKEHNVHPLSSCLPILIQMPILIALYYTVMDGLHPDKSVFIYSFMPEFSLADINPHFLIFNLLENDWMIFPVLVGGLQFIQIQLTMAKGKGKKTLPKEMEMSQKMMKYFMPIMIAVFTAKLPAAVGLYWGTSTLYGIVQQLVVNKGGSGTPTKSTKKEDVSVRVLKKRSK